MVAYLATSAFSHLYRKIDCTAADIGALRKAIYSRTVSIPLGLHNLDEIILARPGSPQALAAQLRLMLSISNWRVLLKPCGQLLTDDLRSFAAGAEPASSYLRGTMQNAVTTGITELLESDGEEINEDFAQALDDAKREREDFAAGIRESVAQFGQRFAQPAGADSFEEYFMHYALEAAAALAERAGVDAQCRRRGLHAMLALKSVRMWVDATLSLARAQRVEGRSLNAEDPAEVLHAVTGAAAADTFVTADARALPWLSRVAIYGLQTTDLRTFLTQAVQPPPASANS
jgi:hypothetical protein